MQKIAFAGTDGRTLLSALVISTATSEIYTEEFKGVVIRGTPSMPKFVEIMNWPVEFIATKSNTANDYCDAMKRFCLKGWWMLWRKPVSVIKSWDCQNPALLLKGTKLNVRNSAGMREFRWRLHGLKSTPKIISAFWRRV